MPPTVSRIPILTRRGICLPEIGLWLDPWDKKEIAFVSHAHSDHFGAHGRIVASKATAALIEARFRGAYRLEPHRFGRAWTWRGHRLMLLPAGHTLGSAQIHITRLSDGASLLYSGDFKLRRSRTSEPTRTVHADTLIMETTFGRPNFRFPSTMKVRNALVRFCRECLDEGEVPVLVSYALGKAQELMAQLADAGFAFVLHPSVFEMTEVYTSLGVELPPYARHDPGTDLSGKVLIAPPNAARSQAVRQIRNRRLAMCTGWALTPGAKFRYQVDEVFPLSDHADYPELLAYVEAVKPGVVLTTHGYAAEFARDLRDRGYEAWSLGADDQLEFSFGLANGADGDDPEAAEAEADVPAPVSEFARFVITCDAVAAADGRREKIDRLADYFRGLDSELAIAISARFFSGRAAATVEELRAIGAGWPVIRLALLGATGVGVNRCRQIAASQNDPGRTAYLMLLHGQKASPRPMALADVTNGVDRLIATRGPVAKAAVLETAFRQMTPAEGQYLVKILTSDMRIGLKDGLIEEAVGKAFGADTEAVREVHALTNDIGEAARLARRGDLDRVGLTLFQPLRPMLAVPIEPMSAVWERTSAPTSGDSPAESNQGVGGRAPAPAVAEAMPPGEVPAPLWLEANGDSIRAQLHKGGGRAELFSPDLRRLTSDFPDIVRPALQLADDVIVDGEIVFFAEGKRIDAPSPQSHPSRHELDLFLTGEVTVRFVVFDLLWHNGVSLMSQPLRSRRATLEAIGWVPPIELVNVTHATTAADLEAALLEARKHGHDGLIAKDPDGPYAPGRRSRLWLSIKPDPGNPAAESSSASTARRR